MKNYSSIWVHLIWTTKNRVPMLHKKFRIALFQFVKQNAFENGFIVDTINGVEDHAHCLVRVRPTQKISTIIKQIKGSSSRWINKNEFLNVEFSWQTGYGAISVSPSEIKNIRQYIIDQEKHHRHWELDKEIQKFGFYNNN